MYMAAKGEVLKASTKEKAAVKHSVRVNQHAVVWKTENDVLSYSLEWGF